MIGKRLVVVGAIVVAAMLAGTAETARANGLDIQEVHILAAKDYEDGVAVANPWWFEIRVVGESITDADFDTPGDDFYDLTRVGLTNVWIYESGDYATYDALRADFDGGAYSLCFNEIGDTDVYEDEVALYHFSSDDDRPEDVVGITYPTGSALVPLNPTYTWTSASDLDYVYVLTGDVFDGDGDRLYGDKWTGTGSGSDGEGPDTTSWQPGTLDADRNYALEVGTWHAERDGGDEYTDLMNDKFKYYSSIGYINSHEFQTVPEPASAVLLLSGGILAILKRRRK